MTWSDQNRANGTHHNSEDTHGHSIEIEFYGNGNSNSRSQTSKTRKTKTKADTPHFQNGYNDYVRDKLIKPSHAKRLSNGHKYANMMPQELLKAKSASNANPGSKSHSKSNKKKVKTKSKSSKRHKHKHKIKNKHHIRDKAHNHHELDIVSLNNNGLQMRRARSAAEDGYDYVTGYDHHEHKHDILNLRYHQKPEPPKDVHLTLNIPKSVPKPEIKDLRRRSSVRSFGALYSNKFRHDVAKNYRSTMTLKDEFKSQLAASAQLSVVQYYHDNYIGQNGIFHVSLSG